MLRSLRCCLNPKVIGGLAAVGLVVLLLAPASSAAALPLLITLVCPLSMGAMAWGMRRGDRGGDKAISGLSEGASTEDVDAELRELREDLAIARARLRLAARDDQPLT